MSNPLFQALGGGMNPQFQNLMQRFQQFKSTFQGDPQQPQGIADRAWLVGPRDGVSPLFNHVWAELPDWDAPNLPPAPLGINLLRQTKVPVHRRLLDALAPGQLLVEVVVNVLGNARARFWG